MLLNFDRTAACICPFCSSEIKKSVSAFDFSGNAEVELDCNRKGCGEYCAAIIPKGKKYKIQIECPFCTEEHNFAVTKENLWGKKLLALKCPETGMDIFYFGNDELVSEKISECSELYTELAQELDEDGTADIMYQMLECLGAMANDGGLSCSCGNGKIQAGVTPEGILVACSSCGKVRMLAINEQTLEELINTDTFKL